MIKRFKIINSQISVTSSTILETFTTFTESFIVILSCLDGLISILYINTIMIQSWMLFSIRSECLILIILFWIFWIGRLDRLTGVILDIVGAWKCLPMDYDWRQIVAVLIFSDFARALISELSVWWRLLPLIFFRIDAMSWNFVDVVVGCDHDRIVCIIIFLLLERLWVSCTNWNELNHRIVDISL